MDLSTQVQQAKAQLDAHVRDIIQWHFDPEMGSPFWLEFASKLSWDPRQEIHRFEDLKRFPEFQDEWLRGGPVRRWVPKGCAGKPIFVIPCPVIPLAESFWRIPANISGFVDCQGF